MTTIADRALEYHQDSQRYFPSCHTSTDRAVAHFALGLVGEVEELAEAIDELYRATPADVEQCIRPIADEAADVVIYALLLLAECAPELLDDRADFPRTTKSKIPEPTVEQIAWAAARVAQAVKKALRDDTPIDHAVLAGDLVFGVIDRTRDLLACLVITLPEALDAKRAAWKAARDGS